MTLVSINPVNASKRVLLLGCGDIGQRLAPLLADLQYSVVGARRRAMADSETIHYQQVDATNIEALQQLLQQRWDVVVMTMTPSSYNDEGYRQGYVVPVQNLLTAYENEPWPSLVVFVSSTGVYGQNDGSEVDEHSPTEPSRFSGKRLLEAEQLLRASNVKNVCVRFSGIYGPGRERLITLAREKKWQQSDQAQWTNRIHVDDCAGVIAHLVGKHSQGETLPNIVLGSDSEAVSSWDIKQWLAHEQGSISNHAEVSTYSGPMKNKRCNSKILRSSGYKFIYPSYREGYREVLISSKKVSE